MCHGKSIAGDVLDVLVQCAVISVVLLSGLACVSREFEGVEQIQYQDPKQLFSLYALARSNAEHEQILSGCQKGNMSNYRRYLMALKSFDREYERALAGLGGHLSLQELEYLKQEALFADLHGYYYLNSERSDLDWSRFEVTFRRNGKVCRPELREPSGYGSPPDAVQDASGYWHFAELDDRATDYLVRALKDRTALLKRYQKNPSLLRDRQ